MVYLTAPHPGAQLQKQERLVPSTFLRVARANESPPCRAMRQMPARMNFSIKFCGAYA